MWYRKFLMIPHYLRQAGVILSSFILFTTMPSLAQSPASEYYQDFRGKKPLLPFLELTGPDIIDVNTPEDEGLRITLPATKRSGDGPVGVKTTVHLTGDFEVTGTYEILSADRPPWGSGVGVALNLFLKPGVKNFAKVGRFLRVQEGEAFVVEAWNNNLEDTKYIQPTYPAKERAGQLRLKREGALLRFQVAEPAGSEFKDLYQREDFGTEETSLIRFVVANQGAPAGVSVRLVDFKISSGNKIAVPGTDSTETPRGWLAAGLLIGLMIILSAALGLGFFLRRQRSSEPPEEPAEVVQEMPSDRVVGPVYFQCSECAKKLKTKAELTGRKIKCPQCGQAVVVPGRRS